LATCSDAGPHAARGAVHEHRLALGQPAAQLQGEVRRVVVEDERGTLGEVELVGQRERQEVRCDGHLGEAAERAECRHPVARRHRRAVGCAAHDPRDLAPLHERKGRLELVLAASLQDLGERHAGGVDVHDDARSRREHMRRLRLGELRGRQRPVRSLEVLDPHRSHGRRLYGGRRPPVASPSGRRIADRPESRRGFARMPGGGPRRHGWPMTVLVVYESVYGNTHAIAGLRELGDGSVARAAAFDTRADKAAALTGSAARSIARRLRRGAWTVVSRESFLVDDSEGPLADGELERARAWGAQLATR
jgi:hypothetical protein